MLERVVYIYTIKCKQLTEANKMTNAYGTLTIGKTHAIIESYSCERSKKVKLADLQKWLARGWIVVDFV